jgi:hypothetical protein
LLLPYRVFSKDQRVSHTAIVENKRLGHALTIVKAQQDLKRETKVMTNSEKTGYTRNPRAIYGPDFVEKGCGLCSSHGPRARSLPRFGLSRPPRRS